MKKFLIIRLSSLGDLVILSSLLEFLAKKNIKADLVIYKNFEDLYRDDPRINRLIPIERTLKGKIEGIKELWKEEYDVVCDCHRKLYTLLLTLFVKAKKRLFVKKRGFERRKAVWFKKKIKEIPLYRLYIEPFKKIFGEVEYPYPKLISAKEPDFSLPEKYAVFVPGASKKTKMWPMEYYLELAEMVHNELNLTPVFVDGKPLNLKNDLILDISGKTSIRELAHIIKNSEFVVSNDTGPAHMAAALSVSLFVIFGSTIPEFGFRPVGEAPVFLFEKKLPCRPCSTHGRDKCPFGHLNCLRDIKPREVFEKIKEFYLGKIF